MKKILIALCLILSTAAAANAQWFVGGNIGFSESFVKSDISETDVTDYRSESLSSAFSITPRVGYMFNDRWMAGLGVGYRFQRTQSPNDEGECVVNKTNTFSVSPFVRCNVLWFGPFMLGIEATGSYLFSDLKDDQNWNRQVRTYRSLEARIAPVLELDVSKNLSLECRLNFLSIGYAHTRYKTILERDDYSYRDKGYLSGGSGVFSGDEVFNLGDLTFGMIYKF